MNKLRGISVVGMNASNLCGSEESVFGLLSREENRSCFLVGKVQVGVGSGYKIPVPLLAEVSGDSRTHKTAMASDINF